MQAVLWIAVSTASFSLAALPFRRELRELILGAAVIFEDGRSGNVASLRCSPYGSGLLAGLLLSIFALPFL